MKNYGLTNIKGENKSNKKGISLMILIITIIVIIILASIIMIALNTSNPINESNDAKYEYDRDQIQSAFKNTVAKIMAVKTSTVIIVPTDINEEKTGVKDTTGEVEYILEDSEEMTDSRRGKIIFDINKSKANEYYTGVRLPIYKDETTWYADEDGNISLRVGEKVYGKQADALEGRIIGSVVAVRDGKNIEIEVKTNNKDEQIDSYTYYIRPAGKEEWQEFTSPDNKMLIRELDETLDYEIKVKVKKGDEEEESQIKLSKHTSNPNPDVPDDEAPIINILTNGGEYIIEPGSNTINIPIRIEATDEISGIDELKYQFTTSETTPEETDENWKDIRSNAQVIQKVTGGTYYLYVKALDVAGNKTNIERSNPFEVKYKITYNANGGSGEPSEQLKTHDAEIKLTSEVPTRTGYTFLGWSTNKEESEIKYIAGSSYTNNESVTLYAIWNIKSCTVVFDANGGSEPSPNTITKNYNETLGTLPTTSREYYTFEGWYTSLTGGTKIDESTTIPSENTTYYARWKINVNIEFTKNLANKDVIEGEPFTLSVEAISIEDVTYQWYYNTTNSTENGTKIEGATNKDYTATATSEIDKRYYYCIASITIEGSKIDAASNTALLSIKEANYSITRADTTRKYISLADAHEDATDGDTITVLKDVEDNSDVNISKGVILNTNEKTITRKAPINLQDGTYTFTINGNGAITNLSGNLIVNLGNATMEIEGANLTSDNKTLVNQLGGTINISSGTIESKNACTIYNNAEGIVNISGTAELKSLNNNLIINVTTGEINISGGTLIGCEEARDGATYPVIWNEGDSGKINITGGNISSEISTIVYNKAGGIVTISGNPELNAPNSYVIRNLGNGEINVNGGTLIGCLDTTKNMSVIWNENDGGKINISGGNISSETSSSVYNQAGGTVTVSETAELESPNNIVIRNKGTGEINISGGTLIGDEEVADNGSTYPVIWNETDTGQINITGGKLTSKVGSIISNQAGGTVTVSETAELESPNNIVIINNGTGEINISGGTLIGDEEVDDNGSTYSVIWNVADDGKINITGGKLTSKVGSIISNQARGTVTVSETAELESPNNVVIRNKGTGEINISGGNISSLSSYVVWNIAGGTVTVSGGILEAQNRNAIYNQAGGKIEVKDGIINAFNSNVITNKGTGEVNISGGTLIGDEEVADNGSTYPVIWNETDTGQINITGGNISSKVAVIVYNKTGGTINISENAELEAINSSCIYNAGTGEVNVSGGTVIGTSTNVSKGKITISENANLKKTTGNVINNVGAGEVNINGGTITGAETGGYPTIVNQNDEGKINITGGDISLVSSYAIWNQKKGKITISGGSIESQNSYGVFNQAGGTIEVNDGTIKALNNNVIRNMGVGEININGGTIIGCKENSSTPPTIWNNNVEGKININGGDIISDHATIIYNLAGGPINISGNAKLTSNDMFGIYNVKGGTINIENAIIESGNIAISQGGAGEVTINNGKITSKNGAAITNLSSGTINLISGTVTSSDTVNSISNSSTGTVTVGSNLESVSQINPCVKGKAAVFNSTGGTFNFYNGILKGADNTNEGTITNLRDDADLKNGVDGIYKTAYYGLNGSLSAVFNKNLENINAVEGESFTLSVDINANANLSYQWFYNTTDSTENGTKIEGATSNEYTDIATNEINQRYYYCVVTVSSDEETMQRTSNTALVTVLDANYSITKSGTTKKYNTLLAAHEDAISNASETEGGTITVLKDVQEELLVPINKNITLNTNEKTITLKNPINLQAGTYTFKVIGNGTITSDTKEIIDILGESTLEIDGVNLTSSSYVLRNMATGNINIKSGTITSSNNNTIKNDSGGMITISGGTVESLNTTTIFNQAEGMIKILDGTIKSLKNNVINNYGAGEINISGGNIIGNSNPEKSYPAIWNETNEGKINITGGNISSEISTVIYNKAGATLNISGNAKLSSTDYYGIFNVVGGDINIDNATIESVDGVAISQLGTGVITINNATIKSTNSTTIRNSGTGTIILNDGIIESENKLAINNIASGIININGGNVKALKSNAINNSGAGEVNINGGTVIGCEEAIDGSTYPVIWNETDDGVINVIGGKVTSKEGTIINNKAGGTIKVTGGNLEATNGTTINNSKNGTIEISGEKTEVWSVTGVVINNRENGEVTVNSGYLTGFDNTIIKNSGAGQVNVNGGVLIGAMAKNDTPGILNETDDGRINMSGGIISVGTSDAIYNKAGGTVNITGDGTDVASKDKSGVFNESSGTVTINGNAGVSSTDNYAIYNSGSGKIIIDKGNRGMISSLHSSGIYNKIGTIEVKNGKLETLKGNVINNKSGRIDISGGTFIGNKELDEEGFMLPVIWNETDEGIINISGGTFTSKVANIINNKAGGIINISNNANLSSEEYAVLHNEGVGTINILGGTLTASNTFCAVSNDSTGTITVGSVSAAISKTNPCITGGSAVDNLNGGTFNFYNGILKGAVVAYDGTLTNKRSGATYTTSIDGAYKTAFYQ